MSLLIVTKTHEILVFASFPFVCEFRVGVTGAYLQKKQLINVIASSLTCNKRFSSFTFVTACKRSHCDQPLLLVVVCENISCSRRLRLPPSQVLVQHPRLVVQCCPQSGCTLLLCCSKPDPSCPSKNCTRGPATSMAHHKHCLTVFVASLEVKVIEHVLDLC